MLILRAGCLLLLLSSLLLAGLSGPVRADDAASAALARIATNTFPEVEGGLNDLAQAGEAPTALAVVQALAEGRLFVSADRTLLVRDGAGGLIDGATGSAVSEPAGRLVAIKLNNRVRRAVESALAILTLTSPKAEERRAAALAVFKTHDPALIPALEQALARESDPQIRALMANARAAAVLSDATQPEPERLKAAKLVGERGDQDALTLLKGAESGASPALAPALQKEIDGIERWQGLMAWVQNAWYGLSLGSVLLLAAIGLAITFGVMGIINMAHGEMVMLGAYTTFVVQELIRTHAPELFDWSLPIAVPLAFLVSGLVGLIIERTIIQFLYGRPLETLLATWGVSLVLQQAIRTIFGPDNREVGAPSYMSGVVDLGGLSITYGRFWIIIFSLVVFAGLSILLRATPIGLHMRAVTQNRSMAASMGIRTPWIDALTFALGSGIAGIAGVALSQIDNVSPNLGQSYIIDSFMVVVFGGVGNLWGTLLGAFSLGLANKFLEPVAGAVLGKILVLIFIILFIQKRPRGLFALKGRAVEA